MAVTTLRYKIFNSALDLHYFASTSETCGSVVSVSYDVASSKYVLFYVATASQLQWYSSGGVAVALDASLGVNGLYYAEVLKDQAAAFSVTLAYDSSLVIDSAALQATNNPDASLTEAVGTNWVARPALGSTSALGGTAAGYLWEVNGAPALRYRVAIDTGATGGLANLFSNFTLR